MQRLIMCMECAQATNDKMSEVYLALFGPQGLDLDDSSILISSPIGESNYDHPLHKLLGEQLLTTVTCDGICGRTLAVSSSSKWYLEQKLALDGMRLQ